MYRSGPGSICNRIVAALFVALLLVSCGKPLDPEPAGHFFFGVADVGQGLSQVGMVAQNAIIWDMGPPDGYESWKAYQVQLGNPRIASIIISHSDLDHRGGLGRLESQTPWTGLVLTSLYEDTALIRANAGVWGNSVRFRLIGAGDTVGGLDGVSVECLWPPRNLEVEMPLASDVRNRYSLVFQIRHGANRILVTSDIDSVAGQELSLRYGAGLASELLVVPHHGSAGSLDPVFFGYIAPSVAVIPCGVDNSYGHPDRNVLILLSGMGPDVLLTALLGNISFISNGHYLNKSQDQIQITGIVGDP